MHKSKQLRKWLTLPMENVGTSIVQSLQTEHSFIPWKASGNEVIMIIMPKLMETHETQNMMSVARIYAADTSSPSSGVECAGIAAFSQLFQASVEYGHNAGKL
jgi:hypothetical protein